METQLVSLKPSGCQWHLQWHFSCNFHNNMNCYSSFRTSIWVTCEENYVCSAIQWDSYTWFKLVYCCIKFVIFLMLVFGYDYWNSHKEAGNLSRRRGEGNLWGTNTGKQVEAPTVQNQFMALLWRKRSSFSLFRGMTCLYGERSLGNS